MHMHCKLHAAIGLQSSSQGSCRLLHNTEGAAINQYCRTQVSHNLRLLAAAHFDLASGTCIAANHPHANYMFAGAFVTVCSLVAGLC